MRAVLAGVAASAVVAQQQPLYKSCQWTKMGANYDLSPMQIQGGGQYAVTDEHDPTKSYYFNFCADVPAPPGITQCGGQHGALPLNLPASMAWQVDYPSASDPGQYCYIAGGPAMYGWNYSLIDPVRPHLGLRMTIPTGEATFCPWTYNPTSGSWGPRNRTFTVELQCSPTSVQTAYSDVNVFETDGLCTYRLVLPSIAGCPTQCITNTGANGAPATICNGNGICGYDSDNTYTKCFCYTGWGGSQCSDAVKGATGMSVEGGLLIAACLILAGVLGMTGFMFFKLRKLQIDPAAYSELEGRFNELGMVA